MRTKRKKKKKKKKKKEGRMGAQKKGATRFSEDPEELARVPLQAILLADSFTTKFRPITLDRPKVLSLSISLSMYVFMYVCMYLYVSVCIYNSVLNCEINVHCLNTVVLSIGSRIVLGWDGILV